jgi:hypothetical protein
MAEVMKERPAYVRFEKRPIEDRDASLKAGHYVAKDVVFALITSPGGKDTVVRRVESVKNASGQIVEEGWLDYLEREASAPEGGRFPMQWVDMYRRAFEKFMKGEEAPVNGTPIKDWPPLSPAQKTNLIACNVFTVEDLANLNSEGQARIGMGVIELQRKAKLWLEESQSIGKTVALITALESRVAALEQQNQKQRELIEKFQKEKVTA